MMREPVHHPGDYDENGLLKAPVLFWVVHVLTQEGRDHDGETARQRYRIYREKGSKAK
ncbi:hypothetical protein OCD12_005176 [Salmonella enterica]|nr:hypothetical protein [Salmonella enterica]